MSGERTCSRSVVTVALIGLLLSVTSPSLLADPPSAAEVVERFEKAAEKHEEAGEHFEAERIYRRLYFVAKDTSRGKTYSRKLASLGKKVADEIFAIVEKEDPGTEDWVEALQRIQEFDPKHSGAKKLLKKHGYRFYNGQYRTKDECKAYDVEDARYAEKRAENLGVTGRCQIIREGDFRFFTDAPVGNQQLKLMMRESVGIYHRYLNDMKAFDLRIPSEGLDVVIFQHEEDYRRFTKSAGTVGLYVPSHGASYFYLSGRDDITTLLHELTHQFNHKVGYFGDLHTSISEGMAEYYGFAKRKHVDGNYVRAIHDHVFGRPTDFVYTDFHRFLNEEGSVEFDFYQQSWAFYYYLAHSPDHRLRFVLYDYLVDSRADTVPAPTAVFQKYGFSSKAIEKDFLDFWRAFK